MLNNLITHKLKEIVKLQDIIKLDNLSYASNHEKNIISVNLHCL